MNAKRSAVVEEGFVARLRGFIFEDLWHLDLHPRSLTAQAIRLLQLVVLIAQGFVRDQLLLRASALTYVTILSLMPLMVVMVAFVGLVGGQQTLVDMVINQLTAVSPEVRELIQERVMGAKIGSMGSVGASLLVVTTVLALRHLERTLNEIWGVRVSRGWMRRFSDYLAVLVVAPILTGTAISLSTTLQSGPIVERLLEYPQFASLYGMGLARLPQLLFMAAFTFLYWFFPDTRVRPLSALFGALVATILFSAARYFYVDLSVGSARYSMLFGGMVALPLILVWIYTCWAVILLGAEVAFAHQNLNHYRRELRGASPAPAEKEAVALRIGVEIARAFVAHRPPPNADSLAVDLDVPVRIIRELLQCLEDAELVVACESEVRGGGYVPSRPIADVSVSAVLRAMRGVRTSLLPAWAQPVGVEPGANEESTEVDSEAQRVEAALAKVLGDLDRAQAGVGDDCSLSDILSSERSHGRETERA